MPFYASIGSISSGTVRTRDLLPCFYDELTELARRDDCGARRTDSETLLTEIHARRCSDDGYSLRDWQADVDELFEALDAYAPPYCYFGAHEGDGANYGFWVSEDSLRDAHYDGTLLAVDDLSEVPDDYVGAVLHVNDHGNTSLYLADCGKLTEIWSVV